MRCRNPVPSLTEIVLPKRIADVVRLEDGSLVEHWHVIQDEAGSEASRASLPTFGETFPD
jgi:hypothetical protein